MLVHYGIQAKPGEQLLGSLSGFALAHTMDDPQGEGNVLQGSQVVKKSGMLKDEPEAGPIRGEGARLLVDEGALDRDFPGCGNLQSTNNAQQRRFPTAGWPDQCEGGEFLVEVDTLENLLISK